MAINREYTERLFDCFPAELRKKVLRSYMKGHIHGFRTIDAVPLGILKSTLRNSELFAKQFLDAVAEMCGCSSEQYADETQLPPQTRENFWGLFAWLCKTLDNSQDSCERLQKMLQDYENLTTTEVSTSMEYVAVDTVDLTQDESEGDKLSSNQKENHMTDFTQYIGYVQETNGYYNFWPVHIFRDGVVEQFDASEQEFPELGNIYLSSTPWDYVRKRCSSGEILVITISPSDLIENRRRDGFFQRTNYKVDFNQMERQGKIKRLKDVQIYPVLHPVRPIDFSQKTVLVKEKYVDTNDFCLIEEANILYGPYRVSVDEDGQTLVNLNLTNNIVDSYQPKNGEIDYVEIDIDVPGYPHIKTYNVRLDDRFTCQVIDKIADQDLLELFQRSLANQKDSEKLQVTPALVDDYTVSEFYGLPDEIVEGRVQRIKALLEAQLKQEDVQKDVVEFVSDLLYKFGNSDYFSNLLERILDNSNLAQKIQSFAIVEQRLQDMRRQCEELQQEHDAEQKKWDEETADRNRQIAELANSTSVEIRTLNSQKEALQAEILEIQAKRDEWKQIDNLELERKVLERRLSDREKELKEEIKNLEQEEAEYREARDRAKKALEEKLTETAKNTVNAAFDGKIADQVLQVAAKWNQTTQDSDFKRIAAVLTSSNENSAITGDALVAHLLDSVRRYRQYSRNDILNIFLCITQNFLTIFSGEPGTGKTSICNIVAHILGTSQVPFLVQNGANVELDRYVPISVERGWTSKRDFIGYYNPLSQAFEQANKHLYDGLRLLDAEGKQSKYPYIVLLDEANLSPIEYYWADFMNICDNDSRFNKITLGNDIQLKIPPTLRFVATINNDDTTERISPRLIDRAALIRLPDVPYMKVEDENLTDTSSAKIVEWASLQAIFAPDVSLDLDTMPNEIYKNICKLFRENMKLSVSPRVDRAIRRYWAAAKNLFESEAGNDTTIIALDYAVAQKLLPKINGSGKAYSEFLDAFKELCEKNNLEKSRAMLANIIKRGKASMDYYQYF